jgi:hypothetical protein
MDEGERKIMRKLLLPLVLLCSFTFAKPADLPVAGEMALGGDLGWRQADLDPNPDTTDPMFGIWWRGWATDSFSVGARFFTPTGDLEASGELSIGWDWKFLYFQPNAKYNGPITTLGLDTDNFWSGGLEVGFNLTGGEHLLVQAGASFDYPMDDDVRDQLSDTVITSLRFGFGALW